MKRKFIKKQNNFKNRNKQKFNKLKKNFRNKQLNMNKFFKILNLNTKDKNLVSFNKIHYKLFNNSKDTIHNQDKLKKNNLFSRKTLK